MTTFRSHFAFRVDTWTPDGESIVERVAGVDLPGSRGALARHAHHLAARCASD